MAFKITELLRLRKKFPWINITCADLEGGGVGRFGPLPLKNSNLLNSHSNIPKICLGDPPTPEQKICIGVHIYACTSI